MTEIEKQQINDFINLGGQLEEKTPDFIKRNNKCIKASIDRDIESIRFVSYISLEIENYIVNKAIEKGYILHSESPEFLCKNYYIVKNSINLDVQSADYVNWTVIIEKNGSEKNK